MKLHTPTKKAALSLGIALTTGLGIAAIELPAATAQEITQVADEQTVVRSGNMIVSYPEDDPESAIQCTISVYDDDKALTAGHCGEEGNIIALNNEPIGVITRNLLNEGTGFDAAQIDLNDDVYTQADPIDPYYQPQWGDRVGIISDLSGGRFEGQVTDPNLQRINVEGGEVIAWVAQLPGRPGDSGGPVYANGHLVGLVEGGDLANTTFITPLGYVID